MRVRCEPHKRSRSRSLARFQRARAGDTDNGQYDEEVDILAAKSAGMFIRKEVFNKIGGFDDDYFIYVEETDLGWRSWLAGYRARYISDSIVYHEFGSSTIILGKTENDFNAKFNGTKNYIMTLVKNLGSFHLLTMLPLHVTLWVGLAWFSLLKGRWRHFYWIHKAIFWNIKMLRKNLAKRRKIQKNRRIKEKDLFEIVSQRRPFLYFINKATKRHQVGNAEGFIKSK